MALRYRSQGEVHKDFHRLLCATCRYLAENHGASAVKSIATSLAKDVYKTMHEALRNGDCDELCEYWKYYYGREGGDFTIAKSAEGARLTVRNCPAQRHLQSLGECTDPAMCELTKSFNEALAEGSPYEAVMIRTGAFSCEQKFMLKDKVAQ